MASLVMIYPATGERFPVIGETTLVGRGPDCQVRLTHKMVSRRHARIIRRETDWLVEDETSENGIAVNDVPVKTSALRVLDRLTIGVVILELVRDEDEAPDPASGAGAPAFVRTS